MRWFAASNLLEVARALDLCKPRLEVGFECGPCCGSADDWRTMLNGLRQIVDAFWTTLPGLLVPAVRLIAAILESFRM
jgi:hypothetical protein